MSTLDFRTSSADSVQQTDGGTQSTRLRAMLRLKTCVSRTCGTSPLHKMRATACPTVPKPSSATREPPAEPVPFSVTLDLCYQLAAISYQRCRLVVSRFRLRNRNLPLRASDHPRLHVARAAGRSPGPFHRRTHPVPPAYHRSK